MLQRDYFIRIIQEFMAAVSRFLEKDIDKRTDEDLKELYRQYVGDYDLLRNLTWQEAIDYAREEWERDRQVPRLEMLAELWYAEASYKQQPLRDLLLQKAFYLFDFVDHNSQEFSPSRQQKMRAIKAALGLEPGNALW